MHGQSRIVTYDLSCSPSSELHIRIDCGGRDIKLFWINLLRKKWISIGSFDRNFRIRRWDERGNPIQGPDQLVENPHVTIHGQHHYHLKANGTGPVFEALTWGAPRPGASTSPWIRFVTSPLRTLTASGLRHGKNVMSWKVPGGRPHASAVLVVDFASGICPQNAEEVAQARYIKWGAVLLKIRIGLTDGRPALIELH
jgi:hypothetical protein